MDDSKIASKSVGALREVEENMTPGEFEPRQRFMMITVVMIRQEDFP